MNRFGGTLGGFQFAVQHVTDVVHSGGGAFRADTTAPIASGKFGFVSIPLTGFFGPPGDPDAGIPAPYVDTRSLVRFDQLEFRLRNDTGARFTLTIEIKDFRDSNSHVARRSFAIDPGTSWVPVVVDLTPLNLSNGWNVIGSPDLSRVKQLALVVDANRGDNVSGTIRLDDLKVIERGGALNPQTAPLSSLVDRLAERHFFALWGSRDPNTGLVPSITSFADVSALNATAATVKLLPGAVARGWISLAEANACVDKLVDTLNAVMDNSLMSGSGGYLPPRYIDRVTLRANFVMEESPIDAAFMFLALYQYKKLPGTTPALATKIQSLTDRFDFASFAAPNGWRLGFANGQFSVQVYDGYSGEVWVISLAAHLSAIHHVDIATLYHSAVFREQTSLVTGNDSYLVHSFADFRAPFLQFLFPLFVDVSQRSVDSFPDPALATNPWRNAVNYQRDVNDYFASQNREEFLQPDAGDDGSGAFYQQFSAFRDFGQPDLFMPWSASFSVWADSPNGELALRHHLANDLHGPLGLTDSVKWATGAAIPSQVTARHDYWNVALAAMAFAEMRYGDSQFLTSLPEVQAAIDEVFKPVRLATGADAGGGPHVRVFDAISRTEQFGCFAYDPAFTGGVRVAMGDTTGDGTPDIITAPGPGGGPHVKVFDGVDGHLLRQFFAYGAGFTGGVFVASGDVNEDGRDDIITGAGAGGGPHVRVFSGMDGSELFGFYAYDPNFGGGAQVAAGDVNGDGSDDIITGAGAGGGPHVRVFSGLGGAELFGFFAYNPLFGGGVFVAAGDVNDDGRADVYTGAGAGGGPHVKVFNGENLAELHSFNAYDPLFGGGVRVAAGELNGDGRDDIITGAGPGGGPHVRGFSGLDLEDLLGFFAYDAAFTGGVFVAGRGLPGAALRLAGEAIAGSAEDSVTSEQLEVIRAAAVARWAAVQSGTSLRDVNHLAERGTTFADLPGNLLGLVRAGQVLIDRDAAGRGWFVDPTPEEDVEFALVDGFGGVRRRQETRAEQGGSGNVRKPAPSEADWFHVLPSALLARSAFRRSSYFISSGARGTDGPVFR